ncbi:helix-turn-helix domain-containing protein [Rhizobium leguminosarum]|uniref:helix-turn-helix domain-containing protein n=1 Tax=Rhizobium leguminosarum TaxID=384 RepID=UPI0013EF1F99
MISAKTIGKAVRDSRRALKLTQAELAEAIGKTPDAISQIERGVNVPSVETVAALSKELSVSIDNLIFPDTAPEQLSARGMRVRQGLSILTKLSDRDLEVAVRQLRAFSGD